MIATDDLVTWLKAEPEQAEEIRRAERAAVAAVEKHAGRYYGPRKTLVQAVRWTGGPVQLLTEPVDTVEVAWWESSTWAADSADHYVDGALLWIEGRTRDGRLRLTYDGGYTLATMADPEDPEEPEIPNPDVWDAPENVKQAVRMLVAAWFWEREGMTDELRAALDVLLETRAVV